MSFYEEHNPNKASVIKFVQIADSLRGREIKNDKNFDEKIEYICEGISLRDVGGQSGTIYNFYHFLFLPSSNVPKTILPMVCFQKICS